MLVTIYEPLRLHIPEIHNIPKFTAVQSKWNQSFVYFSFLDISAQNG
jgi:hypothetical protein